MSPRAHRQKNAMNGVHNDDHSVSAHASSGSSNPSSGSDASDAEMHAAADGQHTNGDAAAHPHRRHRIAKRSHNNTVATRPHLSRQDQEIVRIIGQQLNSLGLKLATFIAFVVIRTLILYILNSSFRIIRLSRVLSNRYCIIRHVALLNIKYSAVNLVFFSNYSYAVERWRL